MGLPETCQNVRNFLCGVRERNVLSEKINQTCLYYYLIVWLEQMYFLHN